jgi:hypothetical protein
VNSCSRTACPDLRKSGRCSPLRFPRSARSCKAVLRLPPDGVPAIGTDVLCLGLLMPSQGSVEVNLRAPVVINLHNARGIQCVASDYKASFRLDQNGIWTRSC